jgi:hypothetical protein
LLREDYSKPLSEEMTFAGFKERRPKGKKAGAGSPLPDISKKEVDESAGCESLIELPLCPAFDQPSRACFRDQLFRSTEGYGFHSEGTRNTAKHPPRSFIIRAQCQELAFLCAGESRPPVE